MIIRKLKPREYERLHNDLISKAYAEPLEASYTVRIAINGEEYSARVQPETHNRMAILQAFQIQRDEYGLNFSLITSGNILSSLLEILIHQGVKQEI